MLENTLDRVESGVSVVAQTATEKALNAHQNYYVRPKEAVASAYNAGENSCHIEEELGHVVHSIEVNMRKSCGEAFRRLQTPRSLLFVVLIPSIEVRCSAVERRSRTVATKAKS